MYLTLGVLFFGLFLPLGLLVIVLWPQTGGIPSTWEWWYPLILVAMAGSEFVAVPLYRLRRGRAVWIRKQFLGERLARNI